jgi:hypothetical protein
MTTRYLIASGSGSGRFTVHDYRHEGGAFPYIDDPDGYKIELIQMH